VTVLVCSPGDLWQDFLSSFFPSFPPSVYYMSHIIIMQWRMTKLNFEVASLRQSS
jgi:hypothetical protein